MDERRRPRADDGLGPRQARVAVREPRAALDVRARAARRHGRDRARLATNTTLAAHIWVVWFEASNFAYAAALCVPLALLSIVMTLVIGRDRPEGER